jgi:hypothetical protein
MLDAHVTDIIIIAIARIGIKPIRSHGTKFECIGHGDMLHEITIYFGVPEFSTSNVALFAILVVGFNDVLV